MAIAMTRSRRLAIGVPTLVFCPLVSATVDHLSIVACTIAKLLGHVPVIGIAVSDACPA